MWRKRKEKNEKKKKREKKKRRKKKEKKRKKRKKNVKKRKENVRIPDTGTNPIYIDSQFVLSAEWNEAIGAGVLHFV